MNIYVGNLNMDLSEDELRDVFEGYGNVISCKLIMDRETGRSRGFAFLEMSSQAEGSAAVDALNGYEILGKNLRVNEARPREDRGGRGGNRSNWDRGGNRGGGHRGGNRGGNGNRGGGYNNNYRESRPDNSRSYSNHRVGGYSSSSSNDRNNDRD